MKIPPFWRIWTAFLCLSLGLPYPVMALRPRLDQAGVEEALTAGVEELSPAELADVVQKLERAAREQNVDLPPNTRIHLFVTGGTSRKSHPMINDVLSALTRQVSSSVPYAYLPYLISTGDVQRDIAEFRIVLQAFRQGIRFPGGAEAVTASVGAPFKTEGKDLSSSRDPKFAVTPGAEMFVRRSDGQLWSTMIDAAAAADWFEENVGSLRGLRVVVLGLGGVGSVFVDELEYRGVAEVTAAEQDPRKAEQVSRHARRSGFSLSVVEPDDPAAGTVSTALHEKIAQADVVFNITGLGKPVSDKPFSPLVHRVDSPLRYKEGAVVVDLNYFLKDQNFLTQAREVTPSVQTENGAGIATYSIGSILEILFRETAGITLQRLALKALVRETAIRHGLLPAAGLEEDEAELVGFLTELQRVMDEGNWPFFLELRPPALVGKFFREDPQLEPATVNALDNMVREISRHLQENPPENDRVRDLLRKIQAGIVRYLMSTWNLSEESAAAFVADPGTYQGAVWGLQLPGLKEAVDEERQESDPQERSLDSSEAMRRIAAYLLMEFSSPPEQFSSLSMRQASLDVDALAHYTALLRWIEKQGLPPPQFGSQELRSRFEQQFARWELPLSLRVGVLRNRLPALWNTALVFEEGFAAVLTHLGYPTLGDEIAQRAQKGFKSLAQDYPEHPIWRPFAPSAGVEEFRELPEPGPVEDVQAEPRRIRELVGSV